MDDADRAQIEIEKEEEARRKRLKYDLPEGNPGDCDLCGEWSGRLVKGVCAPCRDKYKLP
jgi:hypothetical protein